MANTNPMELMKQGYAERNKGGNEANDNESQLNAMRQRVEDGTASAYECLVMGYQKLDNK